jgi:hypothetical protein
VQGKGYHRDSDVKEETLMRHGVSTLAACWILALLVVVTVDMVGPRAMPVDAQSTTISVPDGQVYDGGGRTCDCHVSLGKGSKVQNMTFDANWGHGDVISVSDGAIVQHVKVLHTTGPAIWIFANNVTVVDSEFDGSGRDFDQYNDGFMLALWFDQGDRHNIHVVNDYFHDYWHNAIWGSGYNNQIDSNIFLRNHRQIYPYGGGQLGLGGRNESITYNVILDGGGPVTSGMELWVDGDNLIWRNYLQNQRNMGIYVGNGNGWTIAGNWYQGVNVDTAFNNASGNNWTLTTTRV